MGIPQFRTWNPQRVPRDELEGSEKGVHAHKVPGPRITQSCKRGTPTNLKVELVCLVVASDPSQFHVRSVEFSPHGSQWIRGPLSALPQGVAKPLEASGRWIDLLLAVDSLFVLSENNTLVADRLA